jgi:hypothetical protein
MGILERMRVGGSVHGETLFQRLGRQIERQKIKKHEIHHGLRQPLINNGSHNNQPKTGSRDGGKYGGRRPWSGLAVQVQWLVCLFEAPKRDVSKNREMGGALDLGRRRLMMAYNNQPRIGGRDNGDIRADARGWECAWGDTVPTFGASN